MWSELMASLGTHRQIVPMMILPAALALVGIAYLLWPRQRQPDHGDPDPAQNSTPNPASPSTPPTNDVNNSTSTANNQSERAQLQRMESELSALREAMRLQTTALAEVDALRKVKDELTRDKAKLVQDKLELQGAKAKLEQELCWRRVSASPPHVSPLPGSKTPVDSPSPVLTGETIPGEGGKALSGETDDRREGEERHDSEAGRKVGEEEELRQLRKHRSEAESEKEALRATADALRAEAQRLRQERDKASRERDQASRDRELEKFQSQQQVLQLEREKQNLMPKGGKSVRKEQSVDVSKEVERMRAEVEDQELERVRQNARLRFQQELEGVPVLDPAESLKATAHVRAARELITSEDAYVQTLQAMNALYLSPLRHDAKSGGKEHGLSAAEVDLLLRNIDRLCEIHTKFLTDLKTRFGQWREGVIESHRLADIVLEYTPFFTQYTVYVNRHDDASELLAHIHKGALKGTPRYQRFEALEQRNTSDPLSGGQNLASCLIAPIQRVPRYRLLLNEMVKHSSIDTVCEAETTSLNLALKSVSELAAHINDSLRASGDKRELALVAEELGLSSSHQLMQHNGRVLRYRGWANKVAASTGGANRYMFYMFSDALVYASAPILGVGSYKIHQLIPLDDAFYVEELTGTKVAPDQPLEGESRWAVQVHNNVKTFVMYVDEAREQEAWKQSFAPFIVSQAMDSKKRGTVVGLPTCALCDRKFGLLRRKHTCSACTRLVCSPCSSKTDGSRRRCADCHRTSVAISAPLDAPTLANLTILEASASRVARTPRSGFSLSRSRSQSRSTNVVPALLSPDSRTATDFEPGEAKIVSQ